MRRIIALPLVIAVCLAAHATPASAKVMLCNATKASPTCGNVCETATDGVISYSLDRIDPDGAGPKVSQSDEVSLALCDKWNYQTTVPCTSAMVALTQCTAGQLGELVANPESCAVFSDKRLAQDVRDTVVAYRAKLKKAEKDAEAAAELAADPVPPVQ